jgi:hypothetical protein
MRSDVRVHALFLFLVAIAFTLAFLASETCASDYYPDDTTLSGTYANKTIEVWGNITVPQDSTLELINVTLIFHTEYGQMCLFGLDGCSIRITDADGNPDTDGDASIITATPDPWSIKILNGELFSVRNSRLDGIDGHFRQPDGSQDLFTTIDVDVVDLENTLLRLADGYVEFLADDINVTTSILETNQLAFKGLWFNGQHTRFIDCYTKNVWLALAGELSTIVMDCTFSFSMVFTDHSPNAIFRGCRFESTELSGIESDIIILLVVDCQFIGPTDTCIESFARTLIVQGCTFEYVGYAVSAWSEICSITDCRIEAKIGITGTFNQLTVSDTTIDADSQGIWLDPGWGPVNITSVNILNCHFGLAVAKRTSPIILRDCSFVNISTVSVEVDEGSSFIVEGCSFVNVTKGIRFKSNPSLVSSTTVTESIFVCSECALNVTGGSLIIENVTMHRNPITPYFSEGISLASWDRTDGIPVAIANTSVSGFRQAVRLLSDSFRAIEARVEGLTIVDSDIALSSTLLGSLTLTNVSIEDFRHGILVSRCGDVRLDHVRMVNGTDGLLVNLTQRVHMMDLSILNVTGRAIDQEYVQEALWFLDEPTILEDLCIAVVANMTVTEDLTLRNVSIEVRETSYYDGGFVVKDGARLELFDSTIQGQASRPFYMRVMGDATLLAWNSAIVHCGVLHNDPSRTGLSLEGGFHELVETGIEDGMNGLVLLDANITLTGCHVNGNHTGITSTNSDLTLKDCAVHATLVAIRMDGGLLQAEDARVSADGWVLELDVSRAWLGNSTLGTPGVLTRLDGSTLELVNATIEPLGAQGGTLTDSEVDLYDTHHEGKWTFQGGIGSVRTYWHIDLVAVYRWDQSPAVGATVTVFDALTPQVPHITGTCGDDGRMPRKWMLERFLEVDQEIFHSPFVIVVESDGVVGRVEVPGNESWNDVVILVDVSPPSTIIVSPTPGAVINVTTVQVDGTIVEVGSGLLEVKMLLDDGFWEPLEVVSGRWSVQLDAYDGSHNLTVRASDMDGNQVSTETWFLIDTVPPLVSFTDPEPYTPLPHKTVTLKGFVVLGEGSGITGFEVDGSEVTLSPNGTFEMVVTLLEEGENVFIAEAWDEAGNRGEAKLVLVRDTGPPVVVLEDHPSLTNSTRFLVNGTVVDVSAVDVSLDGRYVPVGVGGVFTVEVELHLGVNRMLLVAEDAVGKRVTVKVEVVCDYLINGSIISPIDGAIVKGPYVHVELSTDPSTWVRIVGLTDWTYTGQNGSIALYVELEPGPDQNLTVEFRDEALNLIMRQVTVTVVEPRGEGSWDGTLSWVLAAGAIVAALAVGAWTRLR